MSPEPSAGAAIPHLASCANCGAAVLDKYCGRCGQRLEHAMHSVLHFSREATEDLTHADSRLWSTLLALMFKPGFLTREFIEGRRVKYLPPLRLYLVLSVVFFLVLGTEHHEPKAAILKTDHGRTAVSIVPPQDVESIAARPGETPQQHADRVCNPEYDGPARELIDPFLRKGCRSMIEDGGRTVAEAFRHNLPRAMFIFLPALALVMKLMYRRPPRYYVEHLLFFVHDHAFAFLLLAVLSLVTRWVPAAVGDGLSLLAWLYIAYYLFVSMRQVYGESRLRTFGKLIVLSFTYFIGITITLSLTAMFSVYSS